MVQLGLAKKQRRNIQTVEKLFFKKKILFEKHVFLCFFSKVMIFKQFLIVLKSYSRENGKKSLVLVKHR